MRRDDYNRGGLDYEGRERDYKPERDREDYNWQHEAHGGFGREYENRNFNKGFDHDSDHNFMNRDRGPGHDFEEDRWFGYGRSSGYQGNYGYNEGNTGQNWGGRNYSPSGYGGDNYRSYGQPYTGQTYPGYGAGTIGQNSMSGGQFGQQQHSGFGSGSYGQNYAMGGQHGQYQMGQQHIGQQHMGQQHMGQQGFYGQRNDDEIEREVYDRLDNEWQIPDNADIHAQVKDGVVTLTGQVRNRNAKIAAWNCVWQVPGVEDVHNNINIQSRRRQNQSMQMQSGSGMQGSSTQQNQTNQTTSKMGSETAKNK